MSTTDIANMCENLTLADVDDDEQSMQLPNVPIPQSDGGGFYYAVCRVVTEKQIRFTFFQETMAVIWQPMFGVTMKQLQPHRSEMVVSAIGSFLGTLIHTDEKNWDGSIRLFYRVRVAIDITKSLKKQMKLKRDNGTWAFIDFRYERLPTFCFLCGIIGHGDRLCPKFVNGYDRNLEKPFGAWMRAGFRRTAPTSGQRWVAPETDVERENWKSPAMEAVARGVAPQSDAQQAAISIVEVSVQKQRRSDEGPSVQGPKDTLQELWHRGKCAANFHEVDID
nr:uncharacterized protein LOC109174453 [Ipomoea batatas]